MTRSTTWFVSGGNYVWAAINYFVTVRRVRRVIWLASEIFWKVVGSETPSAYLRAVIALKSHDDIFAFVGTSMASYTQIAFGQVFRFQPSVIHFLLDASRWRKLPLRAENWIPALCNIHFQHFASFFAGHQCSFSFCVVFKRLVAFSGEHHISGRSDFAEAWTLNASSFENDGSLRLERTAISRISSSLSFVVHEEYSQILLFRYGVRLPIETLQR